MKRRSISSCALLGSTQVVRLPSEAISLSATVDRYAAASSPGLPTLSGKIGAAALPSYRYSAARAIMFMRSSPSNKRKIQADVQACSSVKIRDRLTVRLSIGAKSGSSSMPMMR